MRLIDIFKYVLLITLLTAPAVAQDNTEENIAEDRVDVGPVHYAGTTYTIVCITKGRMQKIDGLKKRIPIELAFEISNGDLLFGTYVVVYKSAETEKPLPDMDHTIRVERGWLKTQNVKQDIQRIVNIITAKSRNKGYSSIHYLYIDSLRNSHYKEHHTGYWYRNF